MKMYLKILERSKIINNETLRSNEKFDYNLPHEVERKFIPTYPESLEELKYHESAIAIEQIYLSSPDEQFSLRMRASTNTDGTAYEATLKDRGVLQENGLNRLEVTTDVTPELYQYYAADALAVLRKIRAEPVNDVVVDFYEDGTVQIESENNERWQQFAEHYDVNVIEVTGLADGDNEQRAFRTSSFEPQDHLKSEQIIKDVFEAISGDGFPVMVHIGGRSGSGKSTIVREVSSLLEALGVSSSTLSTDDYHRGTAWLADYNNGQPWEHWDDPIVYDIETMRGDLQRLQQGESILRREIDWTSAEPVYTSMLQPTEVMIIEGIYATLPEITASGSLVYELPTPMATCIGRRLLRDMKERPQFADPVKSLAYMLTDAEPAYRKRRRQTTPL